MLDAKIHTEAVNQSTGSSFKSMPERIHVATVVICANDRSIRQIELNIATIFQPFHQSLINFDNCALHAKQLQVS